MNKEEDEPGTIEYEKPHGSAEGFHLSAIVLEARQVGWNPETLAESQFSSNMVIFHTSWARHWYWGSDRANEASVTEGRELCLLRVL
jgi:hypothetical protein